MKNIKKISALVIVVSMLFSIFTCGVWATTPDTNESSNVLAHWKLQNNSEYFTGDINTDTLKFLDLSGNGNDLEVAIEGNGDQLDIFTWDGGVDNDTLKASESASSLKFNNTWELAKSVDTYESDKTSYSGAYVSGKYLQTVDNAPLNAFVGENGWTVELVFKISADWNNNYNRYTGMFSKQGVVENHNEPAFSMALTEIMSGEDDGSLGKYGTTGIQYVHVSAAGSKTNKEIQNGMVMAEEWMHYMVTNDGYGTYVFLNGELVFYNSEDSETFTVDPSFGWEVGVGRKLKGEEATMNEEHPEGLIRRLFCGSISEIRFTEGYMDIRDSLILENQQTDDPPATVTTTTAATTTKAPVTTPAPVTTTPTTDAKEKEGGCKSAALSGICATVAVTALGATMFTKKKKEQ